MNPTSSYRPTTTERAFDLAKSGTCASFTALQQKLIQEGYSDVRAKLDGAGIRKQLTTLIKGSRRTASLAPTG